MPGPIDSDPLPLEVLVAMARGIKEIPKAFEALVTMAPTDTATLASNEKVAASRPAPVVAGAPTSPGGTASGSAPASGAQGSGTQPPGNPAASAAAQRQRWRDYRGAPDYALDPADIRALMNGTRQH